MSSDRYIRIFDTTLRDGEQAPGATLNKAEKLEVAHQLARLKVDIIEAGFPIASPDDFEAVKRIAGEIGGCTVAGLARSLEADVKRAGTDVSIIAHGRAVISALRAAEILQAEYDMRTAERELRAKIAPRIRVLRPSSV